MGVLKRGHSMKFWLVKTEPSCFSIDDLASRPQQTTPWDGVRNYQARNMMRHEMKLGHKAFFYHSNCETPGIVGIAEVVKASYPDETAFIPSEKHYDPDSRRENPRWFLVDFKLVEKFPRLISLQEMRSNPLLSDMVLLRKGNRLSVTPVTNDQWDIVLKML